MIFRTCSRATPGILTVMRAFPTLARGVVARPVAESDVDAITALIAACEVVDIGAAEIDREDVVGLFARPGFDPSRDGIILADGDRIVGKADVFRYRAEGDVHPAYRGQGLGAALLGWIEDRARELSTPRLRQVVPQGSPAEALLRSAGYEHAHTSWVLQIPLDEAPGAQRPASGVTLRPYRPAVDDHATYELIEQAFGEWPDRDGASFEEWAAFVVRHGAFSPSASRLAEDGTDLVGAALVLDYPGINEGWIFQVATRATHRRRGIARALLASVFDALRQGGNRTAGLSTDSRTGALGLYEAVGMRVRLTYASLAKNL